MRLITGCHIILLYFIAVTPKTVCEALHFIHKWFQLGRHLAIRVKELVAIQKKCLDVDDCRTEMIRRWFNQVSPTWKQLVYALIKMDEISTAVDIAEAHGRWNYILQ